MEILIVGLLSAIFGGVGVRIADHYLNKGKIQNDEDRLIREEFRNEIKTLKAELEEEKRRSDEVERKLDELKDRYYRLIERVLMSYKSDEAKIELLTDIHKELAG